MQTPARLRSYPATLSLVLSFVLLLSTVVLTETAQAQAQPLPVSDALPLLDTLNALRHRIERLQGVLDKVTFGPQSYYFSRLRSWSIPLSDALNDTISRYFFEVLDNDSSFIEAPGDIQVIATPEPSTDLVAMYFAGNGKDKKGQRLREVLEKKKDRDMYRRILESREYNEDKELIDRQFRIVDLSGPHLVKEADTIHTSFDRYGLSVDHRTATVVTIRVPDNLKIRFGHMWGLEAKLGNDEMGLPVWSSGNLAFFAIYNQIKVGGQIPFKWGTEGRAGALATIWKPRQLNGTYGVVGEFDWAFAGGSFLVGFPRSDIDGTFADASDTATVYTIRAAGQIWYSFTVSINNKANLLRIKSGLGVQQIGTAQLIRGQSDIEPIESRFFWSPYFKAEYMNQQFARRFGMSLQYFRDIGLVNLWLEIIPEQLRVEAKFSTILTRDRDPWEVPYFFTIALPYTFSL
jgi:hypothetical protein